MSDSSDITFRIGQQVRTIRHGRGWTLRNVAERGTGVTFGQISNIEMGFNTTLTTLNRVANALDAELVVDLRPREAPAPPPMPALPPDRAALVSRIANALAYAPDEYLSPLIALAALLEKQAPKE